MGFYPVAPGQTIYGISIAYKLEKAHMKEAVQLTRVKAGMHYDYFEKFFVTTADLDLVKPISSGIIGNFNPDERKRENYFGLRFLMAIL